MLPQVDSLVPSSAVVGFYGLLKIPRGEFCDPLYDLTALLRCTVELLSQPDGVVPIQEMRDLIE